MKTKIKLNSQDEGKIRVRTRFALLPVVLSDGEVIWANSYLHKEVVKKYGNEFLWETVLKENTVK